MSWSNATENDQYVVPGYVNDGYVSRQWDLEDEASAPAFSAASEASPSWTSATEAAPGWTEATEAGTTWTEQ